MPPDTHQSKLDRLEAAGIIKQEHFSEHDKKLLEGISDEEIEVLVRLRKKLGEVPSGRDHIRPNIVV